MYLTQTWFGDTNQYVKTTAKPKRELENAKGSSASGTIEVAAK
jgi:hypothetical protein